MPLPPIPRDQYEAHRARRFETRVAEAAAPFEEEERREAASAQSSQAFLGRVEQLASGFEQQETERTSADFLGRAERLAQQFEQTEAQRAAPPAPPDPFREPTRELTKTAPPRPTEMGVPKATGRVEALDQFGQGLPAEDAYSICGPVAAQAFARANGRNPTLDEARALARRVGWTTQGGMNGVANQKRLLDEMGVASRLDTDVDFGEIAADASTGNPVIVSTARHYYYVNGYDPETGKLHVGKTGTARKGGAEWMSAEQIAALDGGINGALYVDNAASPTPSVANTPGTPARGAQQTTIPGAAVNSTTPEPSDVPAPETPWYTQAGRETPSGSVDDNPLAGLLKSADAADPFAFGKATAGQEPTGEIDPLAGPTPGIAAMEGRRFGPGDVTSGTLPTGLRPELRPPVEGEGPLASLERLGAVSDVPNRIGMAVAEAVLSGKDPAQAILETAREGGRAPKGEDILAAAGMPAGDLRRNIGRAIDFGADWRNLIPGLSLTGKGGVVRNLVAEPTGALVGGMAGGEIGERLGGAQGREIGETVGGLGGAVGGGMRYEALASDPATRRLGIIGETPDSRDFSRYMQHHQDEAARRRGRGLPAKPTFRSDTSKKAEQAHYAEQEARLAEEERLAATDPLSRGEPVPAGDDAPPWTPDEPVLMTREEFLAEMAEERRAGRDPLADFAPPPAAKAPEEIPAVLEETGKALAEVADRAPREIKREFLQPEAAMPTRDVNLAKAVFNRTRNVIESMGTAGKELGGRVHEWREGAEIDAAAWVNRMPTIRTMTSSAEFKQVVDVLEGRAKPTSPRIAQAAAEAKAVLDDVYTRAQNAGVQTAEKIEDYFPHVYKDETIREMTDVKRRAEMIRRVMNHREGTTAEEAEQIINRYAVAARDRRHGSLEMARLADLPGYETTREALYNHIVTASRRIHEVAQFGAKDEIKQRLVDRIGAEGYDADVANSFFKTIVSADKPGEMARRLSAAARVYHSVTRLGLSALLNSTQSVNTATVTGTLRTLQSMAKAIPKGGWSLAEREFADKTGVTLDTIIKEMKEGAGFTDKLGKLSAPGFSQVELFNRRVAAIAGRDFAREMAETAARGGRGADSAKRALTKLRLDADGIVRRGGKLTELEEIRAARNIVERTQFRVDPQDLPQFASHPLGKVVAQFQTFGYGQTAFVVREAMEEARQGNALPLVRFAVLGLIAQGAATEARNVLVGRDPEEDPTLRVMQYGLGLTGIVGAPARTLFGVNAQRVPPRERVSRTLTSMLGPTFSTAGDVVAAGVSAVEGDLEPAARTALRQVPVLGQLAVNRVFPYKKGDEPASPPRNRNSGRNARDSSRSRSR